MKRLITLLCSLMMLAVSLPLSAKAPEDISSLEKYATVAYFQGRAPMLNKLNMVNYGIYSDLTRKLKVLQIAVMPTNKVEEARNQVHKLVNDWERGLTMNTSRANIAVWGSPDKDGKYKKVVVGIGLPGQLMYIYMEGSITGEDLSLILLPYQ